MASGEKQVSASYFSASYNEARERFLAETAKRDIPVRSYLNPNATGPAGQDLFTDIAILGNPEAKNRLFLSSATHGVEGYCGSGSQIGFLTSDLMEHLSGDLTVVIIHAINPYGFAWDRRVNEDNVDLNRNFVDFERDLPHNSDYDDLIEAVAPTKLTEDQLENCRKTMIDYGKANGFDKLQEALTRGQYHRPDGVYYGGEFPVWSNRLFRELLAEFPTRAEKACMIDFHTGLGPYGYGELITEYTPGSPDHDRALAWFGNEITSTTAGDSTSAQLTGTMDNAFHDGANAGEAVFLALEFGTLPGNKVFDATRADNWLHIYGEVESPKGREIKSQIRDAFYQDKDDWKEMVWSRSLDVMSKAIKALKN